MQRKMVVWNYLLFLKFWMKEEAKPGAGLLLEELFANHFFLFYCFTECVVLAEIKKKTKENQAYILFKERKKKKKEKSMLPN